MRESDDEWNLRERRESELQRLDRNFNELLQELRVAQTGVQILFAFLLTLAFTERFGSVTNFQRGLYYATLVASAVATSLLIGPVSLHRLLFRRHQKRRVVEAANRLAVGGLVALWLAIGGVLWFITDVLYGPRAGAAAAVVSLLWFGVVWFAIPLRWLSQHGPADRLRADPSPPDADPSRGDVGPSRGETDPDRRDADPDRRDADPSRRDVDPERLRADPDRRDADQDRR